MHEANHFLTNICFLSIAYRLDYNGVKLCQYSPDPGLTRDGQWQLCTWATILQV